MSPSPQSVSTSIYLFEVLDDIQNKYMIGFVLSDMNLFLKISVMYFNIE